MSDPEKKPGSKKANDVTTWTVFGVLGAVLLALVGLQVLHGMAPKPQIPQASSAPSAQDPNKYYAPDFNGSDVVSGNPVKLSSYRGKVVIIDFWATWCGPCRMEIPDFVKLNAKYHDQGFRMIGVSIDRGGDAAVKNFASSWNMNYPIIVDPDGVIVQPYGQIPVIGEIRGIPTSVLVAKDGSIIQSFVGYRPPDTFEGLVQKALADPYSGPMGDAKT